MPQGPAEEMSRNRPRPGAAGAASAGIVLYRRRPGGGVEVLLVHPGGPFWKNRDAGAWSIPKGLVEAGEAPLEAALREFREETGQPPPPPPYRPLPEARLKSGKRILAFAAEGDLEASAIRSNTFRLEWPPHSGRMAEFPEVDRAAWFDLATARRKANPALAPLFDAVEALASKGTGGDGAP